MEQWWITLTVFQQVMFVLATAATFVMLVFLVLMIFGADDANSFDGDVDAGDAGDADLINDTPLSGFSGLRILTLRGALAFLSVAAWSAYGFSGFLSPWLSALIGVVLGVLAAYLMALAFRASMRLESEGNLNLKNAVGKIGTVYIKVPKSRSGIGKVNVTVQERYSELDAVTAGNEDLTTGTIVEITGLENETTVMVQKSDKAIKK